MEAYYLQLNLKTELEIEGDNLRGWITLLPGTVDAKRITAPGMVSYRGNCLGGARATPPSIQCRRL